jgi:predicted transcriptional regulator
MQRSRAAIWLYFSLGQSYGLFTSPAVHLLDVVTHWATPGLQDSDTMTEDVLTLTAQIVSAHITRNEVAPDALPSLIREVYKTLSTVGSEPSESEKPKPAVPITKSVFSDHIVCLECGKTLTMLKRHLMTEHSLTIDQYRGKWSLPSNYPVVAPEYAQTRSALAKKIGLGRSRIGSARKASRKAGGKRAAKT